MFWGLVVQPNKKYSKTVSTPFHVSQAVLDTTTTTGDSDVQLFLKSDHVDYILCILKKSGTVQVPLDLIFSEGDEISFRSVGGTVHLTGYLVDEQDFPNLVDGESSDGDEEIPKLVPAVKQKGQKRQVAAEADSSSENENSGESQGDDDSDDDDEEAVDDESDDEEIDGSDEEDAEPAPKKGKLNGIPNGTSKKVELKHKEPKQKKQQEQQQTQATDKIKVIQGGVKIEDIRVGHGPTAKSGKKVQVYYEGRFVTNNKIFDKTNTGKGFEFVLGRSAVIKGWDVGVQGMKVGGKRRIVCPPNMAYGSKGSPPAIPSNATLVFDVELRGIN